MVSAVLLVVLCALPPLTHAACHIDPKAPEMVRACRDSENHLHEVGTKWRENCEDCSCSANGISCCDVLPSRIWFPPDCKEVHDKTNCKRYAVKKNDPSVQCRILGSVGK